VAFHFVRDSRKLLLDILPAKFSCELAKSQVCTSSTKGPLGARRRQNDASCFFFSFTQQIIL
jgi:hypothetical protein